MPVDLIFTIKIESIWMCLDWRIICLCVKITFSKFSTYKYNNLLKIFKSFLAGTCLFFHSPFTAPGYCCLWSSHSCVTVVGTAFDEEPQGGLQWLSELAHMESSSALLVFHTGRHVLAQGLLFKWGGKFSRLLPGGDFLSSPWFQPLKLSHWGETGRYGTSQFVPALYFFFFLPRLHF